MCIAFDNNVSTTVFCTKLHNPLSEETAFWDIGIKIMRMAPEVLPMIEI